MAFICENADEPSAPPLLAAHRCVGFVLVYDIINGSRAFSVVREAIRFDSRRLSFLFE